MILIKTPAKTLIQEMPEFLINLKVLERHSNIKKI